MSVAVLLVDDVDEVRVVLRQALRLRGGFDVVSEADDGESAIAAARASQPDVIVLDLGLPDLAGQDVLSGIRAVAPAARVIVFSGLPTADLDAIRSEVEGFVSKDDEIGYLVKVVEQLGRQLRRSAVYALPADTSEIATARQFVLSHLEDWDVTEMADDALLVATELVTNALLHAGTGCELRVSVAERVLRIEVVDSGPGTPEPQSAAPHDEHGRGLLLISALCPSWGFESLEDGRKMVWAELLSVAS